MVLSFAYVLFLLSSFTYFTGELFASETASLFKMSYP